MDVWMMVDLDDKQIKENINARQALFYLYFHFFSFLLAQSYHIISTPLKKKKS